jgi:hypothetical protein
MPEKKYVKQLVRSTRKFDITRYREPDFLETHASFEGTPKKHSTDKSRVILVTDPFSDRGLLYEFPISAVSFIEEIETVSSEDGRSAPRVRLWIRKGAVGFRYEPFIV